ncbi:MAG: DUF2808 domain-containing protein [Xenococcaceae cyanobacterium MO_207.B15]|nr:DUF2808 domain-containing protein [Xenococcaceae cyanobacterium MO_207.B15]
MLNLPISWKRFFTTLAISGCIVSSIPLISYAQGGLTIFSGVNRENILNYYLDYNGKRKARDRYRLRISGKKLTQGAAKFFIKYPDYFDGKFNTDRIEVRVNRKESLPLREVIWDQESQIIEIDLEEPLRESRRVELVFSGVRNPDVGTYYFHCDVLPAVDLPIRQYVGTWIISINP